MTTKPFAGRVLPAVTRSVLCGTSLGATCTAALTTGGCDVLGADTDADCTQMPVQLHHEESLPSPLANPFTIYVTRP